MEAAAGIPQATSWQKQDTTPVQELEAASATAFEHSSFMKLALLPLDWFLAICAGQDCC
jgi:hypothetical protein